jgi:SAM-dependent methyltransferase
VNISIVTPSNNFQFLPDAYESFKDQDFYEWIILRNGAALDHDLNIPILDERIKIFDYIPEKPTDWIGLLKNEACSHATGDIILELDHDDLLMPTAIEKVKQAFEDPEVGFVYSNCAQFLYPTWTKPNRFNTAMGWKWRDFTYQDHVIDETVSFPPTPASISKIWFAPDHLRSWRKSIYDEVGGHSREMRVLDDEDLMCRLYLKSKFKHIDECLYLYRITGANSWSQSDKNQEIQANVMRLYDKYIYQLCERWCDINSLLKIDLGGRFNKPAGYLGLDYKGSDITCNLMEKWPFEDNSIGLIRAHDILEHLPDKTFSMREAHRVLVPGGYFLSMTPSALGQGGFQDPTHISFWVKNSFLYYTNQDQARFIDNTSIRFKTMRVEEPYYPTDWFKNMGISYVKFDGVKLPTPIAIPGPTEI